MKLNDRVRGERAHLPSAHDVKWEAQPGALNPLSAGPLILHVNSRAETCDDYFVYMCLASESFDTTARVI